MPDEYHNYVDGEWVASETGQTFENRNPAAPTEVIGEFQKSSAADTEQAVAAAAAAQEEWAETPGPEREAILQDMADEIEARADELAQTLTHEEGKSLSGAEYEIGRAVKTFDYYASKARDYGGSVVPPSGRDATVYTVREPVGVVGLITPWNFPVGIPIWKMAPALATGNTVVLKPASLTPNVMRAMVECFDAVDGLPDGVVNFVTGPGSEVGDTLLSHDAVDVVSFTGSTETGMQVYRQAATNGKRVQTEMGGKNPTAVMPSADLDEAINTVGRGAFSVTGQACTACSRAIIHEAVHDEFVAGLVDYAESLTLGPGLEDPDMGPQVSEDELETTLEYIDIGKEEATLAAGGSLAVEDPAEDGYFVEPTVFTDVETDMRIAQEEIFGPVISVIEVSDFDEAVAVANDTDYGLSASVMTNDLTEANRFIDEVKAGMTKVNDATIGLEMAAPFGGFKDSSSETWREQGDAALDFFTISKTAYMNY
jgi:aldehyde dehydrogenase (NAD+)